MELILAFGVFVFAYLTVLAVTGMMTDLALRNDSMGTATVVILMFLVVDTLIGSVVIDMAEMIFIFSAPWALPVVVVVTAVLIFASCLIFAHI